MNKVAVKTNIMCGSCIANVAPVLNDSVGESNWKIDVQNPQKILTVTSENITEEDVIKAVQKAGYKAEKLS